MPRILDKNGRELHGGDRVERVFPSGKSGGMVGEILDKGSDTFWSDGTFWVRWNKRSGLASVFRAKRRRFTRTYRCNDLELVETAKEAVTTGCQEGHPSSV